MNKQLIKKIVDEKRSEGVPEFVIKNILKEKLQYPVLHFLYSSNQYKELVFLGGSCLRICYGLPRLSEDLDFDCLKPELLHLDFSQLATQIQQYFDKKFMLPVVTRVQPGKRIYLQFPILRELELANQSESDFLYVKLEFGQSSFQEVRTALTPILDSGLNFIIRHYPLQVLFVGKINAFLNRVWFKGSQNEVDVKGRDFFDLYWFLNQGIEPDWQLLKQEVGIADKQEVKQVVKERVIKAVTPAKLSHDLKNFISDQQFITEFCKNYPEIINNLLDNY